MISTRVTRVVWTAVTAAGLAIAGQAGPASAASAGGASAGSPAKFTTFPDRPYSVAATDANNVWAAGLRPDSSLIVHWNGTAWSPVPSPNPSAGYLNDLFSVVAICPHNAWAVGTTDYAQTLITHWNGKTWS